MWRESCELVVCLHVRDKPRDLWAAGRSSVAAMLVRVRHAAASIVLAASMATTRCRSAFLVSLEQAAALARYSRQTHNTEGND